MLIAVYLVATLTAAIRSEEAFLRRAFGDQYDLLSQRSRGERRSSGASRRRFSLAQAMANREYARSSGSVIAMLLLALKATYNDSFWRAAWRRVRKGG